MAGLTFISSKSPIWPYLGLLPCSTETIIFFGTTDENISTFQVKVEKFAQVVHSMQALLVSTYIIFLSNLKKINFAIKKILTLLLFQEEEMDLVQGQVIKITEIIDKDWYRGESNGKTGIFPASFVRIIDSFPGDVPPDSADLSSYLKNPKRYHSTLLSSKLFG